MVCPANTRTDRRLAKLLNERARLDDAIHDRRVELLGECGAAVERMKESWLWYDTTRSEWEDREWLDDLDGERGAR